LVIHGVNQIKALIDQAIVISSGGGGIPVYRDEKGGIQGVEAVIDKDHSGLKLAQQVEADAFMMLTDVSNVCVNFGKPNEEKLETISVDEAKAYVAEGQFPAGSMLPKIEAAIQFVEMGKEAIICSFQQIELQLQS